MDNTTSVPDERGILGPQLTARLLPYLAESVVLFSRTGRLKARVGPPDGILGWALEEGASVFANLHPDDLATGIEVAGAITESEPGWSGSFRFRLKHHDGSWRPYQVRVFNMLDDPELEGVVLCVRETVPDVEPPAVLSREPIVKANALVGTPRIVLAPDGVIGFVSPDAVSLLGRSEQSLLGQPFESLADDEGVPTARSALAAVLAHRGERTVVFGAATGDGPTAIEAALSAHGTDERIALVTVELTDRSHEPELVRQATSDPLTGLANRMKVTDLLAGLLLEPEPHVSVIYADLDRLKEINDAFGHSVGDEVLLAVADHLRAAVRRSDLVGRMGGDEFVVVCPGLDPDGAQALAQRISEQVTVDHLPDLGPAWAVTLSAGAATSLAEDDVVALLHRADEQMYRVKRRGRFADAAASPTTRIHP